MSLKYWNLSAYRGAQGDDAPNLKIQYSADGTNWHDTFTEGDLYMRTSCDDGLTWSGAMQFIQNPEDLTGTFPNLVAGDITPKSNEPVEAMSLYAIQTTGGNEDLQTGDALFLSIKGYLDENLNPFIADTFVSTGMNLVDPSMTLTIDGRTAYYFPIKKGTWGAYGTTEENNGYEVFGTTPYAVCFKTTKPTAASYGSVLTPYVYNGRSYYLTTGDGWLVIIAQAGAEVPACHLSWSGKYDTTPGNFGNTSKSLHMTHTWGMAHLEGPEYSVFDEENHDTGKSYPRIERINLGNIAAGSWAVTSETVDETTVYTFKYALPTAAATKMKPYGLWRSNYSGLEVDHESGKLVIVSTAITSVEDLVASLAGKMFYYELNTVTAVNIPNAAQLKSNTVNDMGLSYFMYNGELVTVTAYVTEAFFQGGKDWLWNNITYLLGEMSETVAPALCDLDSRLSSVVLKLKTELADMLVLSVGGKRRTLNNFVGLFKIKTSDSPITLGIVPMFVGQECYDTTNKIKYEAFGISSASDWVALNS